MNSERIIARLLTLSANSKTIEGIVNYGETFSIGYNENPEFVTTDHTLVFPDGKLVKGGTSVYDDGSYKVSGYSQKLYSPKGKRLEGIEKKISEQPQWCIRNVFVHIYADGHYRISLEACGKHPKEDLHFSPRGKLVAKNPHSAYADYCYMETSSKHSYSKRKGHGTQKSVGDIVGYDGRIIREGVRNFYSWNGDYYTIQAPDGCCELYSREGKLIDRRKTYINADYGRYYCCNDRSGAKCYYRFDGTLLFKETMKRSHLLSESLFAASREKYNGDLYSRDWMICSPKGEVLVDGIMEPHGLIGGRFYYVYIKHYIGELHRISLHALDGKTALEGIRSITSLNGEDFVILKDNFVFLLNGSREKCAGYLETALSSLKRPGKRQREYLAKYAEIVNALN